MNSRGLAAPLGEPIKSYDPLTLGPPQRLKTPGYDCFSVKFDPFNGQRIACGASENFGMKGRGRVYIFDQHSSPSSPHPLQWSMDEGVYDVTWSEINPSHLISGEAHGKISLLDTNIPGKPINSWKEHSREVSSLDWNVAIRDRLLSSSYDGSIKTWSMTGKASLGTFQGHQGQVYQAAWSPREGNVVLSVGADRTIRLWDDRHPRGGLVKTIAKCHEGDILGCDWNKYDSFMFATCSADLTIGLWDWRNLGTAISHNGNEGNCLMRMKGHRRAVRRVKWSPYARNILFSVGYDMAMRVWNKDALYPMMGSWEGHTEFATGLDINLHDPSLLVASCSWDQSIALLRPPHWGPSP